MRLVYLLLAAALSLPAPAYAFMGSLPSYAGAAGWDDTMQPALSVRLGATAPDDCNFVGDATLVKALCFTGTTSATDEEVHFTIQIPHGYKVGSDLYPHVHWAPTSTGAGNVVWQLEYTVSEIGGTFGAASTEACTATAAGGTAWVHKISGCTTISDAGLGISSIMYGRLFRDPDNAGDTYEADAALLGFDIHYYSDTTYSTQPTSK